MKISLKICFLPRKGTKFLNPGARGQSNTFKESVWCYAPDISSTDCVRLYFLFFYIFIFSIFSIFLYFLYFLFFYSCSINNYRCLYRSRYTREGFFKYSLMRSSHFDTSSHNLRSMLEFGKYFRQNNCVLTLNIAYAQN
jgi:hypothetical protein